MARFNMRRKLTNMNLILNRLLRSCTLHDYDFISINMYNIKDNSCELLYFIFVPNFGLARFQAAFNLTRSIVPIPKKFQVSKKNFSKKFQKNPENYKNWENEKSPKYEKSSYILT